MNSAVRLTRMKSIRLARVGLWTLALFTSHVLSGQNADVAPGAGQQASEARAKGNANRVVQILGLQDALDQLRASRSQTTCAQTDLQSLVLRQQIVESITASSLEVDSVLSEIQSEKSRLYELRALLANRRDRSLGLLNIANLVTGAGLGIVTNALQFSDSTAQLGDQIGVASGGGTTVLSLLALRWQRGPQTTVKNVPNMLAPLFGHTPELNASYPPTVLAYLNSAQENGSSNVGSRLEQLKMEWIHTGRLGDLTSKKTEQQIARLTAGPSSKAKLSIDDISNRIAMITDVAGRVGLMKRDLANVMRSMPPIVAPCSID